ncbi:MAG TPA: sugar phosphate isomerase/epimerase [Bacteroidales bacterium]|nr:sugar phosphate isomerase/epimerase [Bacteroidales bacterium]
MTTRRNFLKKSVLFVAAVPLVQNELMASSRLSKETGLALYTIRDDMAKDPAAALAKAAAAGYNWVEAASYSNREFYGLKPAQFGKMVSKAGLDLISTHNQIGPDNDDIMIEDAAEAELKYMILPSMPHDWSGSLDGYKKAAEYFNLAGEKCKRAGLRFGFHNHQAEFSEIDGKVPYDILIESTDPRLVIFEIDLAWITAAGKDPLAYFNKYPGRFEMWHLKDLSPEKQDATLGEGIIDFKPILAKARQAGMKYWFLEQDDCRTHTPMESITVSRNYYLGKLR